jgi:branched-chain amino acid transport system permease protein
MTRAGRVALVALGLVALAAAPLLLPTDYDVGLFKRCLIAMIVAIGLNILIGLSGLVSLGQAGLYGIGSYTAAFLAKKHGVGFLATLPVSVIVPAIFGALLAYPTVRVKGVYLAVITIAFGLIVENVAKEWIAVTGGTLGIMGIPKPDLLGIVIKPAAFYYVIAAVVVLAFALQYTLTHSHYGRALRATAQSENAARALGLDVAGLRTLAFVVSAAFAGLAGHLYAYLNLYVNYETFTFGNSLEFLLMVILGGTGTVLGPVVGAAILTYLPEFFQQLADWQRFAYGAMLAFVMFAMPLGVVGTAAQLNQRIRARPSTPSAGDWPLRLPGLDEVLGAPDPRGQICVATDALTLRFGGLVAVNRITERVRSGTVHALIGPNGAGKSSLLNAISGFYRPSEGTIQFCGRDVTSQPSHRLARLGIARTFQNTELFGAMTVLENVLVGFHGRYRCTLAETLLRLPRHRRDEARAQHQARLLLRYVGLADYADELARNLPFGHQRRLEIARALALGPKLLLLDEPAAGLTTGEIDDLVRLIRDLAAHGLTIVVVEHHVDMIMAISDHVTVLDYGEAIASGPADQVRDDPRVIEAYFGARPEEAPVAAHEAAS